jgi:hypothetical protein
VRLGDRCKMAVMSRSSKGTARRIAGRLLMVAIILFVVPAWIAMGVGADIHSSTAVYVYYAQFIAVVSGVGAVICFMLSLFLPNR